MKKTNIPTVMRFKIIKLFINHCKDYGLILRLEAFFYKPGYRNIFFENISVTEVISL